jgi:hypothetical protein
MRRAVQNSKSRLTVMSRCFHSTAKSSISTVTVLVVQAAKPQETPKNLLAPTKNIDHYPLAVYTIHSKIWSA